MKRRRSLYARPEIVRGQQCTDGARRGRGAVERRAASAVGEIPTAISVPSATEQHPSALTGATVSLVHHFAVRFIRCAVGEESDTKDNLYVLPGLSQTVGPRA